MFYLFKLFDLQSQDETRKLKTLTVPAPPKNQQETVNVKNELFSFSKPFSSILLLSQKFDCGGREFDGEV